MDPDAKDLLQKYGSYSYIGIFMGVAFVIGFFGGRWLDNRFHTQPWLMLVGMLVGIVAGFRELYLVARRGLSEERRRSQRDHQHDQKHDQNHDQ